MAFIKAIIADVEKLFIQGFEKILEQLDQPRIELLSSFDSGKDVLDFLESNSVDLLFMDLNLTDQDGLDLIPTLKEMFPDIYICVLSAYTDHKFVRAALQRGANAYYSKKNDSVELEKCINEIYNNDTFISKGLYITPPAKSKNQLPNGFHQNGRKKDRYILRQKLTRREQEVLGLITKALNNKEIASELYISHQTVGVHRKNIMRKLGVRNTVNLIKFAMENELV